MKVGQKFDTRIIIIATNPLLWEFISIMEVGQKFDTRVKND